jgi:uncharacterized protein
VTKAFVIMTKSFVICQGEIVWSTPLAPISPFFAQSARSEPAASLGVSDHTSRRYLDILSGAHMIHIHAPWHENLAKRQRRAPKVHLRDSGLLHALLGIADPEALWSHPKCGASWEGFALEHVMRLIGGRDVYYWAVHGGPELDLLVFRKGQRIGFEFKFADAPRMGSMIQQTVKDLRLDKLWIIHPGEKRYALADKVETLPLHASAAAPG